MTTDERNNKEIFFRILSNEFIGAAAFAAGIIILISLLDFVLNLQAVLHVFNETQFFSSLVIQTIIGVAALTASIIFSYLLGETRNQHLRNDSVFRSTFTRIIFLSFLATLLAFILPFIGAIPQLHPRLVGFGFWLTSFFTLIDVALTIVSFVFAVILIRRVVGFQWTHNNKKNRTPIN